MGDERDSWGWRIGLTVALGLVVAAGWASQAWLYHEASAAIAQKTEWALATIEPLETASQSAAEIGQQLDKLRGDVAIVERMVPQALGLDEFRATYAADCTTYNMTLLTWDAHEDKSQDLQRAEINVQVGGNLRRLDELAEHTRRVWRLVDWRQGKRSQDRQDIVLTVYALPEQPSPKPGLGCGDAIPTYVWLWPYTATLLRKQDELKAVCDRLLALESVRAQAEEYTDLATHYRAAVSAVDKLRPGRGPAQEAPRAEDAAAAP
jgi:hypothetical protein